MVVVVQLVRTPDCGSGGRGFESHLPPKMLKPRFFGAFFYTMAFVTYVLVSLSSGRLYIGQTNNLEQRLKRHNRNLNKATKNRGPWKVIFTASCSSRAEAVALENKLKAFKNPAKVKQWIRRQQKDGDPLG